MRFLTAVRDGKAMLRSAEGDGPRTPDRHILPPTVRVPPTLHPLVTNVIRLAGADSEVWGMPVVVDETLPEGVVRVVGAEHYVEIKNVVIE